MSSRNNSGTIESKKSTILLAKPYPTITTTSTNSESTQNFKWVSGKVLLERSSSKENYVSSWKNSSMLPWKAWKTISPWSRLSRISRPFSVFSTRSKNLHSNLQLETLWKNYQMFMKIPTMSWPTSETDSSLILMRKRKTGNQGRKKLKKT